MRVIGMISGTSFDAVEAVVAELHAQGNNLAYELVEHRSQPYPEELRQRIASALPPARTTMQEVCQLDTAIGQFFARVAKHLAQDHGGVDAICSHGQTLYHWVEGRSALGTLQLGEPAWIAEATGVPVVSDVRSRDIAAGGQGAPLASLLDVLLLGTDPPEPCAFLNLGGIANVTVTRPGYPPIAFDTGPANALMDAAMENMTKGQQQFDRDGRLAAQGTPQLSLVNALLADPYFSLPPPKSTGKELFNWAFVQAHLAQELSLPDLLASLAEVTAQSVARSLGPFGVKEVIGAGGGTRNPVLMSMLRAYLPLARFRTTDDLGIPEAAKEALVFAIIGFLTLCGAPATIPSCTGAAHASILGSVTPGATWPLAVPRLSSAPTRLVPLRASRPS